MDSVVASGAAARGSTVLLLVALAMLSLMLDPAG
jgi:hypothetical protein